MPSSEHLTVFYARKFKCLFFGSPPIFLIKKMCRFTKNPLRIIFWRCRIIQYIYKNTIPHKIVTKLLLFFLHYVITIFLRYLSIFFFTNKCNNNENNIKLDRNFFYYKYIYNVLNKIYTQPHVDSLSFSKSEFLYFFWVSKQQDKAKMMLNNLSLCPFSNAEFIKSLVLNIIHFRGFYLFIY